MLFDLTSDPLELTDRGADPSCAEVIARLRAELFDWALHPKGHITTPNAKIAAYASQQLQVKGGILIGIWDEAELAAIRAEESGMRACAITPSSNDAPQIAFDLVAGRLHDRLPERRVGGEFLRRGLPASSRPESVRSPEAFRFTSGLASAALAAALSLLGKFRRAAGGKPHAVPGVGDQIDAVLLQASGHQAETANVARC